MAFSCECWDESIIKQRNHYWTYLLELVAYKFECLVDGIGVSGDGDDAFWARTVTDIDLGSALQEAKVIINFVSLFQLTHCQQNSPRL